MNGPILYFRYNVESSFCNSTIEGVQLNDDGTWRRKLVGLKGKPLNTGHLTASDVPRDV